MLIILIVVAFLGLYRLNTTAVSDKTDSVSIEVKEGSNYFLRIVIDRDKIIDIDTCVEVTNVINPLLDSVDYIDDSYILDVSTKEKGDSNE